MITTIDLGSNSFRAINFDCDSFEILDEFEETISTADGLASTGKISDEAVDRIISAIKKCQLQLKFNSNNAICKTTAAMRKAQNNQEVLSKIQNETGVKFEIIDGDEEARLTLLAIKYAIQREKVKTKDFIVLDIGGGSCELTICQQSLTKSKSFDFGIVTLTQSNDDMNQFLEHKKEEIQKFLNNINITNSLFIATAGTPTTIAAIKIGLDYYHYDRKKVNGTIINIDDIANFISKISLLSLDEVSLLVGSRRVPFMYAGATIFSMFLEALGKIEAIVFDDGLREGIAIDWCINNKHLEELY